MISDVVIIDAVRTAIGTFGGALKDHPPTTLAAITVREVLRRSGVPPEAVEQVCFGNVIHTDARDMYLARVAAVEAGIPVATPALTLNRLCGSGLQAIVSLAQAIQLGDADVAVAGGAESMSRAPHAIAAARWGTKMGNAAVADMMLGALTDPFGNGHMGVTAENVAASHGISRDQQDALAAESHRRASVAQLEGWFASQIIPVPIRRNRETEAFDHDEHIRPDARLQSFAALRPVFSKEGSVTAGNSSGLNDGAAAVLLASSARAAREAWRPRARLIGYALAGVEPREMGLGPIPAVTRLLARTGLRVSDFDVIESNEAFAAQACAVMAALGFDPEKVNPNGGAIALGHPIGATGAILLTKLVAELERIDGRYGLVPRVIHNVG